MGVRVSGGRYRTASRQQRQLLPFVLASLFALFVCSSVYSSVLFFCRFQKAAGKNGSVFAGKGEVIVAARIGSSPEAEKCSVPLLSVYKII